MKNEISRAPVELSEEELGDVAGGSVRVGVNNLSVVNEASSGGTIASPDVSKTLTPAGPVPIPYPNTGSSSRPRPIRPLGPRR